VDFIIGETFNHIGEALLAAEAIKASGLPSVITMAIPKVGQIEGLSIAECGKRLKVGFLSSSPPPNRCN